jgi:2-keto-4-pentenoate hydratase/2-oxohepta-3-ene-1,7-dioic acid hydratase in catechol pathway
MKIATMEWRGRRGIGIVDAEAATVRPVLASGGAAGGEWSGRTLRERIEAGEPLSALLDCLGAPLPLAEVRLLAPIPEPRRNILCIGKNYRAHAEEFARSGFDTTGAPPGAAAPERPIVFTKATTTVIGPGDAILPHLGLTAQMDYEIELAVIIGRRGRGIAPADAYAHVWGYTIVNDITARDLQRDHQQWFLGKSLDTFCPMGPWAVTADEIDPGNTALRCYINGELRQEGNTRLFLFDIPALISCLSAGITLLPGDLIATGTPAGVGAGFVPPRFLRPGDEIRSVIDGIGEMTHRVAAG